MTTLSTVVASILAGDGGNTPETVAARLALIGHAPDRFRSAQWIATAVRCGDHAEALMGVARYAQAVATARRADWSAELEGMLV